MEPEVSVSMPITCDVTMEQDQIQHQVERCRRLASAMTDDEVRHSLEQLAREYEAQLPRRREGFMLNSQDD